ncbi:probable RNA-directed DNA polymerase from transposon X-element [Aspergillus awamori]|uniref:Probable RNA-directed DNA polymerase from transposon X-element n=1 Tax=Aspergillus awamori TaxID=105351 RepID=A0A401L2R8_ASPAW|nr:probable RNA-directed DNA polymerase from transposon X-element [Aspergillus awamori]
MRASGYTTVPNTFRESITVTLRKPGKSDYGQVKSYRPVALLNTLAHGRTKGVSTEQAVHVLLERIQTTWKLMPSHVASVLFLDVSGAFDHVSHIRLLHNLRKRKIDRDTVGWIASFLGNRTTTVRMGDIESDPYTVTVGIPQGSPLSPILYLFYNADLLEAAADSDIKTKLERAHQRAEEWARTHGSKFSPAKYQLMHFTRSRTKIDVVQTMRVAGAEIKPAKTVTYLGITLDPALRWEDQVKQVKRKATSFLKPLTTLAGSTWGAGLIQLRRIYQSVIIPALLYGCSAWHVLKPDGEHQQTRLRSLNKIHTRAMLAIAGAYRTTATAALNIETYQLPMQWLLETHMLGSLLRIATSRARDQVRSARGGETMGQGRIRPDWRCWEWSPLQRIDELAIRRLGRTSFGNLQCIQPYITAPYWTPPDVTIDACAEQAIAEHDTTAGQSQSVVAVYTDGSGINGKIGAAAVCPRYQETRATYMGDQSETTVYAAELQGIFLASIIIIRH